jgi:hypothetical protein
MVKHVLNHLNIPFIERDIVSDLEARRDFMRTGSKILPVLRDHNVVIEGFNSHKLRRLLHHRYGLAMPLWVDHLAVPRFHKLISQPSPYTIFVMSSTRNSTLH